MNYVFEEDNGKYHSVGITHDKATKPNSKSNKRIQNMPLRQNPKKNAIEQSYVRYGVIRKPKEKYSNVSSGWSFADDDFANVKSKIRNFKRKRKKK